jgi:hypothetical protein
MIQLSVANACWVNKAGGCFEPSIKRAASLEIQVSQHTNFAEPKDCEPVEGHQLPATPASSEALATAAARPDTLAQHPTGAALATAAARPDTLAQHPTGAALATAAVRPDNDHEDGDDRTDEEAEDNENDHDHRDSGNDDLDDESLPFLIIITSFFSLVAAGGAGHRRRGSF